MIIKAVRTVVIVVPAEVLIMSQTIYVYYINSFCPPFLCTTYLSAYLRHMVGLHVVYDEVLLRKLNFQQLDVVQQLLPLDQLAGHLEGSVPLLVGRGHVLGCWHGCLQAYVFRLQVQGAGDVGYYGLRLMLLGRHFVMS